jgi:methionyl-tRNA formyltransferase
VATDLRNQVRALQPWPKTYTFWQRTSGEPLRVILDKVHVEPEASPAEPGTVLEAQAERLVVATGAGGLRIEALQPAGKRVLSAGEFLRGYPVRPGQRFG